ncbi:docking protein 1b [Girardinichthys multiradiatus]|uniref:docking protein 1b n=1 Tax=Girardinichthys multiradiatus TaxID=208333 RepID=UPI001FAD3ACC|nr:docking protein 1b [Girardinichthys multiradiatus]
MDAHIKEGQLFVQHQKFGKKWKKNWFVLYPASQNGIARLEFFDSHSGGTASSGGSGSSSNEKTRKLDKKIIRLSECISILPATIETCPKDNMEAFYVETNDKTHVFAAEKNTAREWMNIMCDIAFQRGNGSSLTDSNGGAQDLQMSENLIYYSRDEVNEFWVTVQRTEASERCGLAGNYWLKAENEALILKEPKTKRNVQVWPYKLLRRYGRDRVMFSFEAGRRCDSGPGNFTFETKQGNEIFSLVDLAIQSQKALAEERRLSCPQNFETDCPLSLQYIRSGISGCGLTAGSGDSSSCSSREADGDSGGSKPGSADGVLGKREGGDGAGRGQGCGGGHKGRSLPEPPASRGPVGKVVPQLDEQASLYSEPADSVRLLVPSSDSLYSDPVDTIKGQNQISPPVLIPRLRPVGDDTSGGDNQQTGNNHKKVPDLYSHLYDQIGMDLSQRTGALNLNGSAGGGRGVGKAVISNKRPPGGQGEGASPPPGPSVDHIYDEPEGCAKGSSSTLVSLGMSVYDEARLEPQHHRRQKEMGATSGQETTYSTASHGKPSELQKHSPKLPGLSRGTMQPPTPKFPKPATAPKPNKGAFTRKEPVPLPTGKLGGSGSNINNNNNMWSSGGGGKELYSSVSKQKPPPAIMWCNSNHQEPLRSPDVIYDNLGDI